MAKQSRTIEELIKEYPIIDGHRKQYVSYTIEVTQEMKDRHEFPDMLEIGKYINVNVAPKGYYMPVIPVCLDKDTAERSAKCHNNWLGFTEEEVNLIIDYSMTNSI